MQLVAPGNCEELVEDIQAIHFCLCTLRISQLSGHTNHRVAQSGFLPRRRATCTFPSETHGINVRSLSTSPALLEATGLTVGWGGVICEQRESALLISLGLLLT